MKSRRRIASPQGSEQGIVAGQTGWPEVVKMALRNVRSTPKSGHRNSILKCPLCAKSRLKHYSKKAIIQSIVCAQPLRRTKNRKYIPAQPLPHASSQRDLEHA
jgi:hypothetical protein